MRELALRRTSAFSACRLMVLRLASMSPFFVCPVVRDRSVPPPRTTLDESPEPLPLLSSATFSGDWK